MDNLATDYPINEVVETLDGLMEADPTLVFFQKYSCSGCGNRLTIDKPNVIYTSGACDNCPAVTDIRVTGCNYMLIKTVPKPKES